MQVQVMSKSKIKTRYENLSSKEYDVDSVLACLLSLHRKKEIDAKDHFGYNMLHYAVMNNNEFMVNMLLESRADVNATTAVTAISYPDLTPIELLLSDISSHKNDSGESKQQIYDIQHILLDYGANHQPLVKLRKIESKNLQTMKAQLGLDDEMIHKNKKKLLNKQIVKSYGNGDPDLEKIYSDYYKFLQSRLNEFIVQLKSGTGDLFQNEPDTVTGILNKVNTTILSLIPVVGNVLAQGYEFLSDRQQLQKYKQHMNFLSNHLISFSHSDEAIADYAARMTGYYKEEILQPDKDIGFAQGVQLKVKQVEKGIALIKPALIMTVVSHLTKLPPEQIIQKYKKDGEVIFKKHWDNLVAKTILKFLEYLKEHNVSYSTDLGIEAAKVIIPKWIFEQLQIDPTITHYSVNNAYSLGIISKFVYESDNQIKSIAKKWQFDNCSVWSSDYLKSVIMYDDKKLIIGFRGTHHDVNWLKNLNVLTHELTVGTKSLKVHQGFYSSVQTLWTVKSSTDYMKNVISDYLQQYPDNNIYITGHSLGGAMASICYFFLLNLELENIELKANKIALYTYGQPLWCKGDSSQEAVSLFKDNYHRIINYLDLVPQVPSLKIIQQLLPISQLGKLVDFIHIGKQYYLYKAWN